MNTEENAYLHLLSTILMDGEERTDRTGIGTKSIFGSTLRFSLTNNTIPLLTTKKVFFKGVVEELLFFIRGETNTKKLEEKGVNIWKGNTSREFLDSRGLTYLEEGDMGKGYGYQWRKWGEDISDYGSTIARAYLDVYGIDQLKEVITNLKNDPFSRRHIVSAWNVSQIKEMALPPCHCFLQFYVNAQQELSCQFYMRSVDTILGLPFNIASYALLTHIVAKATGLKAKEVIFCGGDTHIYNNHFDAVAEQLNRKPFPFPHIEITKLISSVEDMEKLSLEDFKLINYNSHPAIKAPMAI